MQNNNRPEGRKRRIEGTGSGLYRRGEGLNTGPVGKGQSAAPKKVVQQFTGNGGGGNYRGKRGGGGGIGIIAIILLLASLMLSVLAQFIVAVSPEAAEQAANTGKLLMTMSGMG